MTGIKNLMPMIRNAQTSGDISEEDKHKIFEVGNSLGLSQYIISLLIITELNRSNTTVSGTTWGNNTSEEQPKDDSQPKKAKGDSVPKRTKKPIVSEVTLDKYVEQKAMNLFPWLLTGSEKDLILNIWEAINQKAGKKILLSPQNIIIEPEKDFFWLIALIIKNESYKVKLIEDSKGISGKDKQYEKIHAVLKDLLGEKYVKFVKKYK